MINEQEEHGKGLNKLKQVVVKVHSSGSLADHWQVNVFFASSTSLLYSCCNNEVNKS